ncbi:polyamine-transporting ATPase 13A2 isoform X1 [Paramormyrops kingsleyae]|uniref:polyamine-transporting ATPase 13A2 isoform X1 n=2 Tax=Paramormyrops kingsleyae TaxID=1676925 RepID=UPI003B96DA9D
MDPGNSQPLLAGSGDPCHCTISNMDVQGYRLVPWRVWLCRVFAVLSVGLLLLLFHWRPRLAVLARCNLCPLALADTLLVRNAHGQSFIVEVQILEMDDGSAEHPASDVEEFDWRDTVHLHNEQKSSLRYFIFEGIRYIWMVKKGAFCPVSVLSEDWTSSDIYRQQGGLNRHEQSSRRKVYGPNLIDVPVKSCARLLVEEVLNPFYLFQIFSIILWMSDNYFYYAGCILVISLISIAISLYEIRKQSRTLRRMAHLVVNVTVRRDTGEEESVSSVDLVPGDCVLIPPEGLLMPCDAALLVGECMINESMLTGESVPVMKTPLPFSAGTYSPESQRRHTLFCGTQVIQARGGRQGGRGGLAVVTRTGFFTAKGDLISSILFPQPINFRFYQDSMKFLLILGALALIGTIYSIVILRMSMTPWVELVVRALDIVTIVVPPALPAAMTTGTIYAQQRLKRHGVFCISPPRINICGKISLCCFDKTGTLTEDGLDVWGVLEGGREGFAELVPDPRMLPQGPMLLAMASCHSVALLGPQSFGDPLELKMIESTGWELEEPVEDGETAEIVGEFGSFRVLAVMRPPASELQPHGISISEPVAILRRFPFSSTLQRMSVVTVGLGGHGALAFLKGAPEMVASLCLKESVPATFPDTLSHFTNDGFRVLALAYKPLDEKLCLKTIEREAVESSMKFLGLLVMKNVVKPETPGVITILRNAQLRTVMVTGDNILTAVNVARTCGMVPSDDRVIFVQANPPGASSLATLRFHMGENSTGTLQVGCAQSLYQGSSGYHLAINGKSFSALCDHFPEHLPKVLMRGTVYARMSPEQKTRLVTELQKLNYCVGMCGDGANDCGALKAADAGVSLSQAEASIASPFTSSSDSISCVPLLIREGRCSLVTSFSLFKYMAIYSLIQFSSVLILYTVKTNLGDLQFLFFDLVLVTSLAIVMGMGGPSAELYPRRPPASLLSVPVLCSLLVHFVLLVLIQVSALLITRTQSWYIPLNSTVTGAANLPNFEDTSVFALSGFQYIIMAVVLTKGYPYKKALYANVLFVFLLLLFFGAMSWLVLYPVPFLRRLFKLSEVTDMNYKLLLVALAALNLFTCYLLEIGIDKGALDCLRRLRRKKESRKLYKRLETFLSDVLSWPPLDQTLTPTQCSVIGLS